MSRYETALNTILKRSGQNAENDVKDLYKILTQEDKKEPIDARKLLEHDLGDLYNKKTILKHLPDECKDPIKQEAGKESAEKRKKQKIEIDTAGNPVRRDPTESDSVGQTGPKSESSRPEIEEEEVDVGEGKEYIPKEDDAEFLKKRLSKAIDDIRDLHIRLDDKDKTISQLQEAVKKDSFKTATDEMNVKTWDKIAIPMLGIELRKLPGQGWHFVKAKLEFVS